MTPDYDVIFDGTPHTEWGRYIEAGNRKNAQVFTPRPAPPLVRHDDRGRPAEAIDILGVLNVAKQPITKTEIMQRTGKSRERVYAELQRLIESGHVQRTWSHNQTALYVVVR